MEINQISINETINIPKGNFDFVIEATHNEQLYLCCLEAERLLCVNYDECIRHIRRAIELVGVDLEKWYRAEKYDLSAKEALRTINIDLKRGKEFKNYRKERRRISKKNFFIRHIIDFEKKDHEEYTRSQIDQFIDDYRRVFPVALSDNRYENKSIKAISYDMYTRCSVPTHTPGYCGKEDALNLLRLFRQLLCLINYVQEPYDFSLTPIGDYFPVPVEYYDELGFIHGSNIKMYVSADGSKFYLLKQKDIEYLNVLDSKEYKKRLHEIDMLNVMWERSLQSIGINDYENTEIGTPDFRHQVYEFISKPQAMTQEFVNKIDKRSKREELVRGIIRAIRIMHHSNPPVVNKYLNPECIYVCENRHGIVPFVVKFDNETMPVMRNTHSGNEGISNYFNNINLQKYVAPEIRNNSDLAPDYDDRSADIYSLGKLIKFIYGRDESKVRDFVEGLICKDPMKRPDIDRVSVMYDDEVVLFEPTIFEDGCVLTDFRLLVFTNYNGFTNYVIDESVGIGRMANEKSGDIKVDSPIASRSHGQFIRQDDGFVYMDMNSTNGTFINGILYGSERKGRTDLKKLRIGDIIRIDNPEFKKPHRNAVLMFVLSNSGHEMSQKTINLVNGMDIYVGRDYGDIKLSSNRVSKRHARFVMKNNTLHVQDFDSKNGVYVNGKRIEGASILHPMDSVRIEDYIFMITEKKIYYYAE